MSKSRKTTKQEKDQENTKKSSIGTMKQTEEEIKWKIEVDKDTSSKDASDNLHKNRNPPNKSEV